MQYIVFDCMVRELSCLFTGCAITVLPLHSIAEWGGTHDISKIYLWDVEVRFRVFFSDR
jgi:hypothetical protein